jgi:hypothetical protein
MWNNFDFTELSKLGNQLNEVISKAKNDVESRIDNALGVPPTEGAPKIENGAAASGDPSRIQPGLHRSHPTRKPNMRVLPAARSLLQLYQHFHVTCNACALPRSTESSLQKIS